MFNCLIDWTGIIETAIFSLNWIRNSLAIDSFWIYNFLSITFYLFFQILKTLLSVVGIKIMPFCYILIQISCNLTKQKIWDLRICPCNCLEQWEGKTFGEDNILLKNNVRHSFFQWTIGRRQIIRFGETIVKSRTLILWQ